MKKGTLIKNKFRSDEYLIQTNMKIQNIWSIKDLANKADLNPATISKGFKEGVMTLKTLKAICDVLHVDVNRVAMF